MLFLLGLCVGSANSLVGLCFFLLGLSKAVKGATPSRFSEILNILLNIIAMLSYGCLAADRTIAWITDCPGKPAGTEPGQMFFTIFWWLTSTAAKPPPRAFQFHQLTGALALRISFIFRSFSSFFVSLSDMFGLMHWQIYRGSAFPQRRRGPLLSVNVQLMKYLRLIYTSEEILPWFFWGPQMELKNQVLQSRLHGNDCVSWASSDRGLSVIYSILTIGSDFLSAFLLLSQGCCLSLSLISNSGLLVQGLHHGSLAWSFFI